MSKYTIELRKVCDLYGRDSVEGWFKDYNISDYLTQEETEVINKRGTWNKDKLAKKIVDHYYMREIGFETIGLFKHYVKVKLNELMEEKLPLIYSSSIYYDPLVNVDYTETYSRQVDDKGESSSTSKSNASGITINSDTPQGQISKDEILKGKYASNTQGGESDNVTNDSANTNTQSIEKSSKNIKGNSGVSATAQKMIEQYRNNIRAIDSEIIKELNSLFIGLY